jgi:protein O-GlcNAc transferase
MLDDSTQDIHLWQKARDAFQAGELEEAESLCQLLINSPQVLHMQGLIAFHRKHWDAAQDLIQRALDQEPENGVFHHSLATLYRTTGKPEQAASCYRQAAILKPTWAQAYFDLGLVLEEQKQFQGAMDAYQCALTINPDFFEVTEAVGALFQTCDQHEKSLPFLQKAILERPELPELHYRLGYSLYKLGAIEQAIHYFQLCLQYDSEYFLAYNGLGSSYLEQGKVEEALQYFRKAIAWHPSAYGEHSNLLLCSHYSPYLSSDYIFFEHKKWADTHTNYLLPLSQPPMQKAYPFRIGYISPDLRSHPVTCFFEPILQHHNREKFEVYCYANVRQPDETTFRLQKMAQGWHFIDEMTDEQVAEQIQADQIDILVDLAGHTANHRLRVMAFKPAPVQVTYLGYPDTTGMSQIDYRLVDAWTDPEEQTQKYSETLVRLPNGFLCYAPPEDYPDISPSPLLKNATITFGSFNNLVKLNEPVLALWAEILRAAPQGKLLLKTPRILDHASAEIWLRRFVKCGIPENRIELLPYQPHRGQHLEAYKLIDIALDPFPYNGTTTTCEALWMGVPVITLAGNTHASRVGVSLLSRLGLEELIAVSKEDYVHKAITLAQDLERLTSFREMIRPWMAMSSLCDGQNFTRTLEETYKTLWESQKCVREAADQ